MEECIKNSFNDLGFLRNLLTQLTGIQNPNQRIQYVNILNNTFGNRCNQPFHFGHYSNVQPFLKTVFNQLNDPKYNAKAITCITACSNGANNRITNTYDRQLGNISHYIPNMDNYKTLAETNNFKCFLSDEIELIENGGLKARLLIAIR